jgi:hypothetical protein
METKSLKQLKEELEYWKYYEAVNNMGKWSKQVRIDKLKEEIEKLETLTEKVKVMGSLESKEESNELKNDNEQTIS